MAISIKLNVFEGPLDLLLHLIDKNKVNIYDIPIMEITEQYMDYVDTMEELNMDITSEFIVMASTLLSIKSKMLLPKVVKNIDEEDPREELVRKLLDYKKYKYASIRLREKIREGDIKYFKNPTVPDEIHEKEIYDASLFLNNVTLEKLYNIYTKVIKQQKNRRDPIRSNFNSVEKEEFKISDKLIYLKSLLEKEQNISFYKVMTKQKNKIESIVTFLAVLELIKMNEIIIYQNDTFEDIIISKYDRCVEDEFSQIRASN